MNSAYLVTKTHSLSAPLPPPLFAEYFHLITDATNTMVLQRYACDSINKATFVKSTLSYLSRSAPHISSSAFSTAMDSQPSYIISGLRMPCVDIDRGRASPEEEMVDVPEAQEVNYSHEVYMGIIPTSCTTDASDGRLGLRFSPACFYRHWYGRICSNVWMEGARRDQ